jgi:L-ascorbate metabolism protein UlaG (beta-lactamase superfamily)
LRRSDDSASREKVSEREISRRAAHGRFIERLGDPTNAVETAGWFQQFNRPDETVKIAFRAGAPLVPARAFRHEQSSGADTLFEGAGKKIYFGGDSGFGSHYRETAEVFPKSIIF